MAMEEITCPKCNVDVDPDELRRNHLRCPTCGHDLSDTEEDELDEDDEDEDEEEDKDKDDDEEED